MKGKMKKSKARVTATATAKSLQSCPTLCNPIDGSSPGSPVPGRAKSGENLASSIRTCIFNSE